MMWEMSAISSDVFASIKDRGRLQPVIIGPDVKLASHPKDASWIHWEGCDVAAHIFARYIEPPTFPRRRKLRKRALRMQLHKPRELRSVAILLTCRRICDLATKEMLQSTTWEFEYPYYVQRFAIEMQALNCQHLIHKLKFTLGIMGTRRAQDDPQGNLWCRFFGMRYFLPTNRGHRKWISRFNMFFPNVQHLIIALEPWIWDDRSDSLQSLRNV